MNQIDTREQILETCKDLIQTKGYHAFTINEIAELLDISSSNVYHHFKNKENLVRVTVVRYRENVESILNDIEKESYSLRECLEGLINVYASVLEPDNTKICLCMTLMVELNTLPEPIIEELKQLTKSIELLFINVNIGSNSIDLLEISETSIDLRKLSHRYKWDLSYFPFPCSSFKISAIKLLNWLSGNREIIKAR